MKPGSLMAHVLTRRHFFIPLCLFTGHELALPFADKSRDCFISPLTAPTTLAAHAITLLCL